MTKLLGLVDADILAYQAAASAETPVNWGDGLWTLHAYEEVAIKHLEESVASIYEATGISTVVMALTSPDNWRNDVLPTYKQNRANVRRPMLLPFIREYITKNYPFKLKPRLEGDDILGIQATRMKNTIVISLDKDMKTIPGTHFHLGRRELFIVSPEEADYNHMLQTLTGDTTDGYAGCPGVGPVTAKKLLDGKNPVEMWEAVVKAYAKAGLGEDEAIRQARVARICRATDYDFKKGEVILWNPPNDK